MSQRYGNIVGWGNYVPARVLTNADLERMVDTSDEWIVSRTGILRKALKQVIQQAGLTTDDIDLFIPHQANRRIIESAARTVGLPEEKVFINIDRYGNTSAASIPIALTEAIEQGRARPGDTLAFVAFGAGLTWAASVVKLGPPTMPLPVDRAWLRRLAWNPLGAVAAGLGRAVAAISVSLARFVGWVRHG